MKRSFPPPAQEALFMVLGAAICGAACAPSNSVKAGAPELIELTLVQPNPPGSFPPLTATTVKPDTPDCLSGIGTGASCLPMGHAADAADGGAFDADVPPDGLCRDAADMNWCTCVGTDANDPTVGKWNCDRFANVMAVVAVFDRVLDTKPFDEADAGPRMDVMTTTASSGAPVVQLLTDYSPTGDSKGFVFNLLGPLYGSFRADGPSLYGAPQPEFPSGATVTVTVDPNMVHAKDHTTPFTGAGLLSSGMLVFTTAPFDATLSPPNPMSTMDAVAATVAFTNFVDAPGCGMMAAPPCATAMHVTATAGGTTVATSISSPDGATLLVDPKSGSWPAGTVTITVDAATPNLVGQTIVAAPAPLTFTAP